MSKTVEVKVKVKGELVNTLDVVQYDDLEEAVGAEQPEKLLKLINSKLVTDARNQEAAKHREKTAGKGRRQTVAYNILPFMTFADGETGQQKMEKIASEVPELEDRLTAMAELIASDEVQAEVDKALQGA